MISICLLIGTFFMFSGSLGLLRFRDVYARLHASTKSATLGVAGILIGALLFFLFKHGTVDGKLVLGIVFVLLTSPLSGHLISRAAYRTNVLLWHKGSEDQLKQHIKIKRQINHSSESKQSD